MTDRRGRPVSPVRDTRIRLSRSGSVANMTLGNITSAITGIQRKLGADPAERCLASVALRYNLKAVIPRFVHSAARTSSKPQ